MISFREKMDMYDKDSVKLISGEEEINLSLSDITYIRLYVEFDF